MEENNQNFVAPAAPQPKNPYWGSIIAVVFIIAFVATIFSPVALSGLMYVITLLTGIGTVIGVIRGAIYSVQDKGPVAKTFAIIGTLFMVIVIGIVVLFTGVVYSLKTHPIEGD